MKKFAILIAGLFLFAWVGFSFATVSSIEEESTGTGEVTDETTTTEEETTEETTEEETTDEESTGTGEVTDEEATDEETTDEETTDEETTDEETTEEEVISVEIDGDVSFDVVLAWLHEKGLTMYDNETDFRGADPITRGEAAKFVNQYAEVLGLEQNYTECEFSDIDGYDETLVPHIQEACAYGLLKGSAGAFMPNGNVTYAQGITIAMRALFGFKDETITPWWQEYADEATELGIEIGVDVETMDGVYVTRAGFGTWLYLAAQIHAVLHPETDDGETTEDEMMDEEVTEEETTEETTEEETTEEETSEEETTEEETTEEETEEEVME